MLLLSVLGRHSTEGNRKRLQSCKQSCDLCWIETDDPQDTALPETTAEADARTKHIQHLQHLNNVHKDPETNLKWNATLKEPSMQRWTKILQVRAYRETCGYKIKSGNFLSAEKLRKRRIADFEVYLDDDGYAVPGNHYVRQSLIAMFPKADESSIEG